MTELLKIISPTIAKTWPTKLEEHTSQTETAPKSKEHDFNIKPLTNQAEEKVLE